MLARYLEEEGVPTTQISLVRSNTEQIKPPRALWVPFEFGRPLGTPNDAPFQKKVLLAALSLFEADSGPVLADFPEDAPVADDMPALSCPVFSHSDEPGETEMEKLCREFKTEIGWLHPWYDQARKKRGRTTLGLSKLEPSQIGDLLASFLIDGQPGDINSELSPGMLLRYAADDLKAFYFEALTAQPGMEQLSGASTEKWFWDNTTGAEVLRTIKKEFSQAGNKDVKLTAAYFLVPTKFSG